MLDDHRCCLIDLRQNDVLSARNMSRSFAENCNLGCFISRTAGAVSRSLLDAKQNVRVMIRRCAREWAFRSCDEQCQALADTVVMFACVLSRTKGGQAGVAVALLIAMPSTERVLHTRARESVAQHQSPVLSRSRRQTTRKSPS